MESKSATLSLSALGHEGRLAVFRLLVSAGPTGLAAGEIARRLGMVPNSLSANLNILSRASLVTSRREGRSIIYQADFASMTALVGFLVADCCGGAPEICSPLNQLLSQVRQCAPATTGQKEVY
jgi:ArsR family transcriptional regulator, arsenate/arsenite/antimonite-responsive transcriptional repressor